MNKRGNAWFMHSDFPLTHSPGFEHFKPTVLQKEDPTIHPEPSSLCPYSWTSGGPTPQQELGSRFLPWITVDSLLLVLPCFPRK